MRRAALTLAGLLILAQAAHADRLGGRGVAVDRVEARSTDVYTEAFYAGRLAVVTVVGDGDTDLDLFVYDENGHLIVSDTGATDRCQVSWVPRWTGRFEIHVVNPGSVYNEYRIVAD